jgi:hypothetical protein
MIQYFSTVVPSANAIAATNAVTQQVASLALEAGKWFVGGEVWASVTAGTPTINIVAAAVSLVSAGPLGDPADNLAGCVFEPNQPRQTGSIIGWVLPLVPAYLNLATATTVYLNAQASWTGAGGMQLYGKITAQGTPAPINAIQASGNFVYLHLADGSDEGYVNMALAQLISPNAAGGSRIRVQDRQINVTEAASDILGAMS